MQQQCIQGEYKSPIVLSEISSSIWIDVMTLSELRRQKNGTTDFDVES